MNRHGVNLTGGIALGLEVSASWSVAIGWDAYDAGSRNDIHVYPAAIEYRFGR